MMRGARLEDVALGLGEIADHVPDGPEGMAVRALLLRTMRQLGEVSGLLLGTLKAYKDNRVGAADLYNAMWHVTDRQYVPRSADK